MRSPYRIRKCNYISKSGKSSSFRVKLLNPETHPGACTCIMHVSVHESHHAVILAGFKQTNLRGRSLACLGDPSGSGAHIGLFAAIGDASSAIRGRRRTKQIAHTTTEVVVRDFRPILRPFVHTTPRINPAPRGGIITPSTVCTRKCQFIIVDFT